MIKLTDERNNTFYLNIKLIEVIFERMGGTSEIKLTNGNIYTCTESPKSISSRIRLMKMPSGVPSK
jgi:uncharacterized protein YlzI (FlbEa/FlbD family)